MDKPKYSPKLVCPGCLHKAPMEIVGEYSQVQTQFDERQRGPVVFEWDAGPIHQMLLCPACQTVSFAVIHYHSQFLEDLTTDILFPLRQKTPEGLPPAVARGYEAALKVRNVDANAFGCFWGASWSWFARIGTPKVRPCTRN